MARKKWRALSGSKLFDTQRVILKECFTEAFNFENKANRRQSFFEKLPSMQSVTVYIK